MRGGKQYQNKRQHWTKTRPTGIPIGQRCAPQPDGMPGYIRIDSVHQGDQDGVKGVYHINAVDSVTQFQLVATCEKISEAYLLPVIRQLLEGFPFVVLGFHADNGSECINYRVAALLEKLRIEFTKSRPRQSNNNALAESKNVAVVRKHLAMRISRNSSPPRLMRSAPAFSTPTSISTARASSRKRSPMTRGNRARYTGTRR